MGDQPDELPINARRARLARKGEALYRKSCGAAGKSSCVQGFVLHHLRRGEPIVVQDLLAYLEREIEASREDQEEARIERASKLAAWIRDEVDASLERRNDVTRGPD